MYNPDIAQIPTTRSAQDAVLEVEDLHVSYGTTEIVRGVSFAVKPGEKIGLVGESGSGKSTLALAILGLLASGGSISRGKVSVLGTDLAKLADSGLNKIRGKDLSLVFQDPLNSLDPVKTIGAQIGEAIKQHNKKMSKAAIRKRAVELLSSVGVSNPESRLSQYPHEYSGGMRQRVLIAIAVANNPAVLIADEPTTALDVTTQAQILELLDELVTTLGISVVLITHDLGVVAEFCDRVLVMYAGRVVESGKASDIFESAGHPYSAALLKSLPLPGRNRSQPLEWIHGAPPALTDIPTGCSFAPRCAWAIEKCHVELPVPTVVDEANAQWAECHRAPEVYTESRAASSEEVSHARS